MPRQKQTESLRIVVVLLYVLSIYEATQLNFIAHVAASFATTLDFDQENSKRRSSSQARRETQYIQSPLSASCPKKQRRSLKQPRNRG
jgi:hypothetical protein